MPRSLHAKSKSLANSMVLKIATNGYSMNRQRKANSTTSSENPTENCNGLAFQNGSGPAAIFTGSMEKLALGNRRL